MRMVYISYINEDIRPGYAKKIHSQSKSFFRAGFDTYLISRNNSGFLTRRFSEDGSQIADEFQTKTNGSGIAKYTNYITSLTRFFKYCLSQITELKADVVYVRRIRPISPMLIKFLRNLRKSGVLVLYEYPTFPWDKEMLLNKQYVSYAIDSVNYKRLLKSINALVCVGGICNETICDVVSIINGVDVDELNSSSVVEKTARDEIRLVCVCHYSPVHGIEKVIDGLEQYYKVDREKKVVLVLVGPQEEFGVIENLAKQKQVSEYVEFKGFIPNDKLDEVYSNSDIGIDAIGLEIRGEQCICGSLKSREYVSKGIPIVCSDMLDIIYHNDYKPEFMYVMDHNQKSLDIESLIEWYGNLKISSGEIRKFGVKNLTWDTTMKPVFDYCKAKKEN